MEKQLKEKLSELDPPGNLLWFFKKYIEGFGFGFAYFTMMLAGSRPMRDDVKKANNEYLSQE